MEAGNVTGFGIVFDDHTVDDDGNVWSQICTSCVDRYELDRAKLDDAGDGICGVVGCSNEASYYVDGLEKS